MIEKIKPNYPCDLHCHTTRSDGNDTPGQLINIASSMGLKAIAITDHDINPPLTLQENNQTLDIKTFSRSRGLELVLGYEFSCDSNVDDVHIIGYELDWDSSLVEEAVNQARESKADAYKKLCEILTKNGMPIYYEDEILSYEDGQGNQRSRSPYDVQRKQIFELMAKKGYASSWDKAKLMVRDNPKLNIGREKINPLKAIEIIKKCGGLAVLAHPYLIDEEVDSRIIGKISRDSYINNLIDSGLDGIESCYTYSKTTYKGDKSDEEIKKEIEDKYNGKVKFFTGGSDYHNDGKKGVKDPRFLGEAGISLEKFEILFKRIGNKR